ncbi:conserved hypothetical protein [Anaeromyxobacter sp. K]|nr:conserved hypothetical protein [Anaeromyxobacter sp. K]
MPPPRGGPNVSAPALLRPLPPMPLLPLLLAVAAAAGPVAPAPDAPPENLLRGPARCVLRYLDAVRLAGPRAPAVRGRAGAPAPGSYGGARALTAPRALDDADRATAAGGSHPLAPWADAARGTVLESFQLLAVRRAPRGTAVVTVRERWWRGAGARSLASSVSEYLVARVAGEWRIAARSAGGTLDDEVIDVRYGGWFDPPPSPGSLDPRPARTTSVQGRAGPQR